MKVFNSLFLGLTIIGVLIYFSWGLIFFDDNLKSEQYELCESKKSEEFCGIISEVYVSWKIDTLNVFAFKLKNGDSGKVIYNYCLVNPETVIEKGDSIYKAKDKFEYHVFKGKNYETEVVINCEDDYCEKWR
jgi:hypothetical protein